MGFAGGRLSGDAVEYVPPSYSPGGQSHSGYGRSACLYRMERPDFDGQRRISGVFSSPVARIREEGVHFASHVDGRRIFMGPEESMQIQSNLGSTIAMAFDECVENPAKYSYAKEACDRTYRWLVRCIDEMARLNSLPGTVNPKQMLFGINQGCTFSDLRVEHMQKIAQLPLDGFAIGGLAVGETAEEMYEIIDAVEPYMPADKPRYLMGVGTPQNILEAVHLGVVFLTV